MSVSIRLARGGSKKRPFFHVVAADTRFPRDGRYLERLGFLNPLATGEEMTVFLETERIAYWLSQGAKSSDRVHSLIKSFKRFPTLADQKQLREQKQQSRAALKQQKAKKAAAAAAAATEETSPSSDE